jgi:myosin-5
MRSVGLGTEDQEQIFGLLSALLHLADAQFDPCPKSDGEGCVVTKHSSASLAAAADLLGCDAAALTKAVTTRTRVTPDGPIVSPLSAKAAADTRDALSKVGGWSVGRRRLGVCWWCGWGAVWCGGGMWSEC